MAGYLFNWGVHQLINRLVKLLVRTKFAAGSAGPAKLLKAI
jgi:hypothetical protein